jgi:hypothetical protein
MGSGFSSLDGAHPKIKQPAQVGIPHQEYKLKGAAEELGIIASGAPGEFLLRPRPRRFINHRWQTNLN